MVKKAKIRSHILNQVKEFYRLSVGAKRFVPGVTRIPYSGRVFNEDEMMSLVDASLDFWLTTGRFAENFERRFADFLNVKFCLLTNSGSSANLLAVTALTSPLLKKRRLKPGDEVITTACGFPTTLNPIIQNNLTPVFLDVDLGTYNARADLLEKAVGPKTKAIFLAHTLGNPVDLDLVMKTVKRHDLWLIEDNCDALGAKYAGRTTGSFGHMATASFYPPHHMTMGEGGAVLTSDPLLNRIVASLRDWGRDCWCSSGIDNTCRGRFKWKLGRLPKGYDHKYIYSHIGYNLKITDLQAAIGCVQLNKLPSFIKARKENFQLFRRALDKYQDWVLLPEATPHSDPSWFGFSVLVKNKAPFQRADLVDFLENRKIATRMLFAGNLTKQPAYRDLKYRAPFGLNNTDQVMNRLFWIGVYPGLTRAMKDYILDSFRVFFKRYDI
jgi:CDP-6-deoxy-D-xylo-4-hexulose-3-dehydrase